MRKDRCEVAGATAILLCNVAPTDYAAGQRGQLVDGRFTFGAERREPCGIGLTRKLVDVVAHSRNVAHQLHLLVVDVRLNRRAEGCVVDIVGHVAPRLLRLVLNGVKVQIVESDLDVVGSPLPLVEPGPAYFALRGVYRLWHGSTV